MRTSQALALTIAFLAASASVRAEEPVRSTRFEVSLAYSGEYGYGWPGTWDGGWEVGIGVADRASPYVDVSVGVAYMYNSYAEVLHYPYGIPAIPGFNWEASGEDSHTYRVSAEVRLFSSTTSIRPFLFLRGGAIATDIGEITLTTWYDDAPEERYSRVADGTGEWFTDAYFGFGLGLTLAIGDGTRLNLESMIRVIPQELLAVEPVRVSIQF